MSPEAPEEQLPGQEQVSRAYRAAGFDDEPSASLDRAILEASKRSHRHPFASVMPPLALAATIVLSVALVMQSGLLDNRSQVLTDGLQSSSPTQPESAPLPPPAQSVQLRALQTLNVDQQDFTAESLPTQRNGVLPLPTSAGVESEQSTDCLASERAFADTWLECIDQILQQGAAEAAVRELEAFIDIYPDREVPATLETLLPL